MSSDPPPAEPEFRIQSIVGESVRPRGGLSESDELRLNVAKRTIDQNYFSIDEYIDGETAENPLFICRESDRQEEGFEALRLLHNYLSSLYSFNETIRVLVNQHSVDDVSLSGSDFTAATGGTDEIHYSRKLAFLRGLRTDFQHGGFSCFEFTRAGQLGDFVGYHLTFDEAAFLENSGLDEPYRFLECTNQSERTYPLCFLGRFHEGTLQEFYEDTFEWFHSY